MVSIETLKRDLDQVLNLGLCPENVSLSAGAEYTTRLPGYSDYKIVPPGTNTGIKWYGNRAEKVEVKAAKPPPKVSIPEVIPSASEPVKDLALPASIVTTQKVQVAGVNGPVNTTFLSQLGVVTTKVPEIVKLTSSNFTNSSETAPIVQVVASAVSLT